MKLLCVADQIDPYVYNSSAKERFGDVDAVISAGDLPDEYLDFISTALNKPVFFVFGNHNLKSFLRYHGLSLRGAFQIIEDEFPATGATYIGFKCLKTEKMLIAGASGCIRYNRGLCQYTERQMAFKLLRLVPRLILNKLRYGRYLDVFVTHAAPLGIHDMADPCHRGFKCFLRFMHFFKPKYLIHGHIHLYDLQAERVTQFENTTVINVYSRYVIDTGDFQ